MHWTIYRIVFFQLFFQNAYDKSNFILIIFYIILDILLVKNVNRF